MRIYVILSFSFVLIGFAYGHRLELWRSVVIPLAQLVVDSFDCSLCAKEHTYWFLHVKRDPLGSTKEELLQYFGNPDHKRTDHIDGQTYEIWFYKPGFGMNSGFTIHLIDGRCEGYLLDTHRHFH